MLAVVLALIPLIKNDSRPSQNAARERQEQSFQHKRHHHGAAREA